jgi:uncharacterized SAM-binding protein YcdF (DUF218 family)
VSDDSPTWAREPSEMRRRRHYAFIVAIGLVAGGSALFLAAPRWLSVEDPLRDCPTIVVLNGDTPSRAEEGARLHHAGGGREVWLTDDPLSGDRQGDAGTRGNARRLVELGVPPGSIHVVPGTARGTRAELEAVAAELGRRRFDCAVIVTSPLHTRRVKITWQRHVGSSPQLVVRPSSGGNYVGWGKVRKELAGSLMALAGFAP